VDRPDRALAAVVHLCERGEVVGTDERGGGRAHRVGIEPVPGVPDRAPHEEVLAAEPSVGMADRVAVALADAVGDRVEPIVRELRGAHANVRRQPGIDRQRQLLDRHASLGGERGHLADGVHAGIGATGADDRHARPGDDGDGLLEDPLHGAERFPVGRLLALPPMEVGAVVGDQQAVPGHGMPRIGGCGGRSCL
jgi:hypothetical protein